MTFEQWFELEYADSIYDKDWLNNRRGEDWVVWHARDAELQSLRDKLRESEAGAAQLREALEACWSEYDSPGYEYANKIKAALSSTAGTEILKEMEELKKALADHHQTNQELLQKYSDAMIPKGEVSELKRKLEVAKEALERIFKAWTYKESDELADHAKQALAEINKQV